MTADRKCPQCHEAGEQARDECPYTYQKCACCPECREKCKARIVAG